MDPVGGKVYWAERNGSKIQRANLDGTSPATIVNSVFPDRVAVDPVAGKVYWANVIGDKIQRADLDGSNVEDVVTGLGEPAGVAIEYSLDAVAPPPSPTVSSVSPDNGTTDGGTEATITGTGFVAGAGLGVTFDGTAATGVTFVSDISITATTPVHAAGLVDVVVTNPDNQSGTLTGGYNYVAPPPPTPVSECGTLNQAEVTYVLTGTLLNNSASDCLV